MAKQEAENKTYKAPGFYRKTISAEGLEKRYIKYLQINLDREFIRACYEKREDVYHVRTNLKAEEAKRLKALAVEIKKNRKGPVNIIPLGICSLFVAGLILFFTLFANPLLQRAMETGLEAIFEARVNANNFRMSLFRFEIGMEGLTIADRDQPMRNLIQFDRINIKLNPAAVLRGKVYIEEIRTDNIRFGTERRVSGALPSRPPREREPRQEVQIPPLVDLQNFDALALLNQEYDKLQTPALYDAANEIYEEALLRWRGEDEAARARIAELREGAEPLLRININDFNTLDAGTIEQIRTIVNDINSFTTTVQAAQDDMGRIVSGVQGDIDTARALEQNARNAFNHDLNHLLSYLDLGSGAALEVLEPLIMSILNEAAEEYIAYGFRALEILEKVKALQERLPASSERPSRERGERFRGRDVAFPVKQYPVFYLGTLAADVLTPTNWRWAFDLGGISSDPDLSGVPARLALSLAESGSADPGARGRSAAFQGRADFRSNADERFNAAFSGAGFPLDINISQAGIGGFSGAAAFRLDASGYSGGVFAGGGELSFFEASLTDPANTFAQAADEAIRQVDSVDLGISYREDHFSLTTNLGEIMGLALRRIAAQYRSQAEAELERVFRAKIEEFIGEGFANSEELDMIFLALRGDMNAVGDLRNSLDRQRNELEERIRGAAEDAARQAADEIRQQGQDAVQGVLEGILPEGIVPSLPSAPSLPANPFRR